MSRQARPIFIKPTLMPILIRNLPKSHSNVQANVSLAYNKNQNQISCKQMYCLLFISNALHSIIYTKFAPGNPYYYHNMGAINHSNFNLGDSNA